MCRVFDAGRLSFKDPGQVVRKVIDLSFSGGGGGGGGRKGAFASLSRFFVTASKQFAVGS